MKSPNEEKFRMIKKTNAAIQKKLLALQGGIHELITDLGFMDVRKFNLTF
jgi:hypothetical protein